MQLRIFISSDLTKVLQARLRNAFEASSAFSLPKEASACMTGVT